MFALDGFQYYTYTVSLSSISAAAALLTYQCSANNIAVVSEARVTGDGANQELELTLQRISSDGSGASTAGNVLKHLPGAPGAKGTARHTYTAQPTWGANQDYGHEISQSKAGWRVFPGPALYIAASALAGVRLLNAPSPALDLVVTMTVGELHLA